MTLYSNTINIAQLSYNIIFMCLFHTSQAIRSILTTKYSWFTVLYNFYSTIMQLCIIISLSSHAYMYVLKKCCSSPNNDVHYTVHNGTSTCELEEKVCPGCDPCYTAWKSTLKSGVLAVGSFGLIFSFTQASIIILLLISTVLYRVSFRWDICPPWSETSVGWGGGVRI